MGQFSNVGLNQLLLLINKLFMFNYLHPPKWVFL